MIFSKHGYQVMVGTIDIAKLAEIEKQASGIIRTGSYSETVSFVEIIVLTTKGTSLKNHWSWQVIKI